MQEQPRKRKGISVSLTPNKTHLQNKTDNQIYSKMQEKRVQYTNNNQIFHQPAIVVQSRIQSPLPLCLYQNLRPASYIKHEQQRNIIHNKIILPSNNLNQTLSPMPVCSSHNVNFRYSTVSKQDEIKKGIDFDLQIQKLQNQISNRKTAISNMQKQIVKFNPVLSSFYPNAVKDNGSQYMNVYNQNNHENTNNIRGAHQFINNKQNQNNTIPEKVRQREISSQVQIKPSLLQQRQNTTNQNNLRQDESLKQRQQKSHQIKRVAEQRKQNIRQLQGKLQKLEWAQQKLEKIMKLCKSNV